MASFNSCKPFAFVSVIIRDVPVRLPPGSREAGHMTTTKRVGMAYEHDWYD